MNRDFRLFGLIGYPLGHSFSVPYFTEKFANEAIHAAYRNFPLGSVGEFKGLVESEPDLKGLNVTVPYKQAVIPYLDELDETARDVGAVNTISFLRSHEGRSPESGGAVRLWLRGSNTDVTGFMKSLEEHRTRRHERALVLGTGGSSRAVVYVLDKLGIPFSMVSRSKGKDRLTYGELDTDTMRAHTLIINTTPVGMYPEAELFPAVPYEAIGPGHLLFDLIYNPAKTEFLKRGEKQGATVVNGYDMLVYQAEASWKIWNQTEENNQPG